MSQPHGFMAAIRWPILKCSREEGLMWGQLSEPDGGDIPSSTDFSPDEVTQVPSGSVSHALDKS